MESRTAMTLRIQHPLNADSCAYWLRQVSERDRAAHPRERHCGDDPPVGCLFPISGTEECQPERQPHPQETQGGQTEIDRDDINRQPPGFVMAGQPDGVCRAARMPGSCTKMTPFAVNWIVAKTLTPVPQRRITIAAGDIALDFGPYLATPVNGSDAAIICTLLNDRGRGQSSARYGRYVEAAANRLM